MVSRIEDMLQAAELACVFSPTGKESLFSRIDKLIKAPDENVLRVSRKHVPFANHSRELIVNAIGRYLLNLGREGAFRERPVIVFLDEAHQRPSSIPTL
jgi:hypothetical protein